MFFTPFQSHVIILSPNIHDENFVRMTHALLELELINVSENINYFCLQGSQYDSSRCSQAAVVV